MRALLLPLSAVVLFACSSSTQLTPEATDGGPTWHRDVQPLLAERCAGCHREGGIGPFALEELAQVRAMSGAMLDAVVNKRMPPWTPDETCQPMKGARVMPAAEVELLSGWVAAGMPEGDVAEAKTASLKAELPWVDSTLQPAEAYTPSLARGKDDYRCFALDPQLSGSKDVIGFQVFPGSTRTVHHVLFYSVPKAAADRLDADSPGFGWECFGGPGTDSPKMVGAWAPGGSAVRFPGQTGIRLFTGDVIVMQVHYNLDAAAPEADLTKVALQYSVNPVTYSAQWMPLVESSFRVPPRSTGYSASMELESPVDAQVWGVAPHMHTRGKRITLKVGAHPTTGAGQACLVDIPQWDFHWQDIYMFASRTGLPVKAGQPFQLTCTWDNPSDQTLRWGEGTGDEMCIAFIYVTGAL